MTNKNDNRRKLLKSIVIGSGTLVAGKSLPENWTKPVIDSVMLPAHAATSPQTVYYCYSAADSSVSVSVAVQGTEASVVFVAGNKLFTDPEGGPGFKWSGTIPTSGSPWSVSLPLTASGANCLDWISPEDFQNPRLVEINVDGSGVPVSFTTYTGPDKGIRPLNYPLTMSTSPCTVLPVLDCVPVEAQT